MGVRFFKLNVLPKYGEYCRALSGCYVFMPIANIGKVNIIATNVQNCRLTKEDM